MGCRTYKLATQLWKQADVHTKQHLHRMNQYSEAQYPFSVNQLDVELYGMVGYLKIW